MLGCEGPSIPSASIPRNQNVAYRFISRVWADKPAPLLARREELKAALLPGVYSMIDCLGPRALQEVCDSERRGPRDRGAGRWLMLWLSRGGERGILICQPLLGWLARMPAVAACRASTAVQWAGSS